MEKSPPKQGVGYRWWQKKLATADKSKKLMLSKLRTKLHGPIMFAVKAKIYGVLYNQSSSIAFDETSSYWSAPKSS